MPFFLTLFYILLLFVRPFDLISGMEDLPVMMWLGLVTLAVTAGGWLFTPPAKRASLAEPQVWLTVAFAGLAIWPWVMIGWADEARYSLTQLQPMLGAFFMTVVNVRSLKRLRWFVATLLLAFVIMATQGIVSYYTGWRHDAFVMDQRRDVAPGEDPQFLQRVRHLGFLNDPNDFAQALITMLPLVAIGIRRREPVRNLFIRFPLAITLLWAAVLTRSRGGLVALAVTLLIALRERLGRVKAGLLTAVLVVGFLAFNVTAGRAFRDESAENRVEAWASGLLMLRDNPVFGVGFNGFVEEHRGLTAHNSFVLAFTETGLVGYFVWMAILVLTYLTLTRLLALPSEDPRAADIRTWARYLRLAVSAFLAGAYFLSRTYVVTLYLLVALAVCLKQVARREGFVVEKIPASAWSVDALKWEVVTIAMVWVSVKLASA